MSDPAPTFWEMTEEEYLRTEPESPVKREFFGGYVYPYPVVGETEELVPHLRLLLNLALLLRPRNGEQRHMLHPFDRLIRGLLPTGRPFYLYADLTATEEEKLAEPLVIENPVLLIEVAHPVTYRQDRTTKLLTYTSLPSLQTYLIVEATRRLVRVIQRTAGGWEEVELSGEGTVPVPCLKTTLTLDDIYAGVLDRSPLDR